MLSRKKALACDPGFARPGLTCYPLTIAVLSNGNIGKGIARSFCRHCQICGPIMQQPWFLASSACLCARATTAPSPSRGWRPSIQTSERPVWGVRERELGPERTLARCVFPCIDNSPVTAPLAHPPRR